MSKVLYPFYLTILLLVLDPFCIFSQSPELPFQNNIQLWYNAENVITENNKISTLIDQSIFNNDAIQSNVLFKPGLVQNNMLGSIIHFGNQSDLPSRTSLNFSLSTFTNQQFTFFFVLKKSEIQNTVNYLLGNTQQGVIIGGLNSAVSPRRVGLFTNPDILISSGNIDTNWFVLTIKSDSIFINSIFISSNNGLINNSSLNTIGTRPDATNFFFHGDFLELILYNTSLGETDRLAVENYLREKYFPRVKLPPNQTCVPNNFQLQSNIQHKSILWSTGDTTNFIDIDSAGTFWVTALDHFNFTSSDTIVIGGIFDGVPATIDSRGICNGDSTLYSLEMPQEGYHYEWNTGDTTNSIYAKNPGQYYVDIWDGNGCMLTSDTVTISMSNYTNTTFLPTNPTICASGLLQLESGAEESVSYAWYSDESPTLPISTEASIVPDASQNYWVVAQNDIGCEAIDTTMVTLLESTPAPLPGFTSSLACSDQEVSFTDTSIQDESSLVGWEWTTSSGQTSSLQDPSFTFEEYGEVLVSLKITNSDECVAFTQKTINVHPTPKVNLAQYDNLCTNTLIVFQDSSTLAQGSITSWEWQVDGESLSTPGPPNQLTHTFTTSGLHELTQIVQSDSGCVASLTTDLNFRGRPISSFIADTVCVGAPVTLTATSDTSGAGPVFYEWINANDEYLGGAQNLSLATGNEDYPNGNVQYPIRLVTHTSDQYCSDTLDYYFRLQNLPNVQVFRNQACIGETVELSAQADGIQTLTSYQWIVDGEPEGNESTFSFVPSSTDYYLYSLLTSTQFPGCETLVEDSIRIYPFPNATIEGATSTCINSSILYGAQVDPGQGNDGLTFEWVINDALFSNDSSFSYSANQVGVNTIGLTIINDGNCTSLTEQAFTVNGANVNIDYIQACAGMETQLIALPDTSFSGPTESAWLLEDGSTYNGHSISIDLGAAGSHWVINSITDTEHNCTDIDSMEVEVSDYPSAQFQSDPLCVDEEFTFISTSQPGFNDPIQQNLWIIDGNEFEGGQITYAFQDAGSYSVELIVISELAACSDTLSQIIEVEALPLADFYFYPESGQVPLTVDFVNESDSAFVYTWLFGKSDYSFEYDPSYTFEESGWVEIRLIAETLNGCSGEKIDSILVEPPKVDLEVIEVIPVWNGSYVTLNAIVQNNGYYTIEEFQTLTSIGTNNPQKQIEFLSISGGDNKIISPSNSWYFDPASSSKEQAYACFEVSLADGSKDEVPENDKACISLYNDAFVVYDPFPNPGSDALTIRMILPEDGTYDIALYSSNGAQVLGESYNGKAGFNQVSLNTYSFSAGNYSLVVQFEGKEQRFSWIKE